VEGKPIEVEYALTPEDFAAWMSNYETRPGRPRWLLNLVVAVAFVGALAEVVNAAVQGVPWPIVAGLVLLIAAIFVGFLFRQRLTALFLRRADIPTKSQCLAVRPEGLTVTTETTASLTAWEGVDRIVVTDTHAFFYLNKVAAHILPRRAFADESGFEKFVETVRTYREAAKLRSAANEL
jgi:hypothetical protein